jgi:type II secretory pathway component PulF
MAIEIRKASAVVAPRSRRAEASASADPSPSWLDRARASLDAHKTPKIGPRDRMFFTERLSLLLATEIPLHIALESLGRQAGEGAMAELTRKLRQDVSEGTSFARALAARPDVFPVTYVNLIGAAEAGGFLPIALERLRDMEERREELRSTLVSAISYPALLVAFSIAVVIFVLVVVFPKFEEIFSMIHDELPITTRWLMAASVVLRRGWIAILIAIGALAVLGSSWLKRPEGVLALDRFVLRVPGLRDIVVQSNVVQMLRVMSLSLEHGVSLVAALRAAREAVGSAYFRSFLDQVESAVQEGRGLGAGFEQEPLMPELVKQMIGTGEESGSLPIVMGRLADFYEREWRRALGILAKIAEPAMLVIMGGVVGLIVSSLILPIFKLSRAVH